MESKLQVGRIKEQEISMNMMINIRRFNSRVMMSQRRGRISWNSEMGGKREFGQEVGILWSVGDKG